MLNSIFKPFDLWLNKKWIYNSFRCSTAVEHCMPKIATWLGLAKNVLKLFSSEGHIYLRVEFYFEMLQHIFGWRSVNTDSYFFIVCDPLRHLSMATLIFHMLPQNAPLETVQSRTS